MTKFKSRSVHAFQIMLALLVFKLVTGDTCVEVTHLSNLFIIISYVGWLFASTEK